MRIVPGLIALALACAAAPCWAQSTIAKIPFEFTVNDRTLPAGVYTIGETMQRAHAVRNTNGDLGSVFAITYSVAVNQARLAQHVFRKYGDKYFLAEVWNPLKGDAMAFVKCRKEKELVTSRLVSGIRVDRVVVLARVR
ncbi:MAG: hypothetical protein JNN08_14200 [Bryobacterales bacterium]|nr:hypothetical protein [Bryobacterales bacterium]